MISKLLKNTIIKKVDAPSGTAKMLVDAVKDVEDYNRVYGRHGDMKRQEKRDWNSCSSWWNYSRRT